MIDKILNEIENPVKLRIGSGNLAEKAVEIAKRFSKINEKIEYTTEKSTDTITIECNEIKIVYQALPIKIEDFAKLIKKVSKKEVNLRRVEEVKDLSGSLVVFISPLCSNCSKVVELAVEFAIVNPKINLRIVDALQFRELSNSYNVFSVPTVVVNEKIKLTGKISEDDLVNALKEDKYYEYKLGYYAYMLREGYADELSKDIKTRQDAKIIGDLLTHPMLKVRIGAMVLLEKLFKNSPDLIEEAKQKVRELLKYGDFRVKEDAALILGKIGNKSDIELLKELLTSENADVRDSAMEAIGEIKERLKER